MSMQLNPYFSFRNTAEEAMTFFRSAFGGELNISRFREYGASAETMPLEPAPWGGLFGMRTDRYGIHWMISIGDES